MAVSAPVTEIGYQQSTPYQWWLYDNETTPELLWPQSIFVYDQMRKTDAQVGSVLRALTQPVIRTQWRVHPNGARDEVVELVADDLGLPIVGRNPKAPPRTRDKFDWVVHLAEALLMLPMGHAYFEQVYRVDARANRAHLRKLALRPSKTIERVDVAADGGLVGIWQYWSPQTTTRRGIIGVDRLVAYVNAREGGNWLGTSILRNCYKNWLLKDRLLRVQAQTIERNGMGIPLYRGAPDATAEQMAAGLAMAKAWRSGEAAGSAVDHDADLVLRGVEGTLPDAEPAVRYHDEQIGRAVLAHFLNLGTQTGSWALGSTFADFFTLSLQTIAAQIASTATQHVIEDLVDVNFGEDEPAPRLTFDEIGSRQAATAEALKSLIDAGVIRPDEVLEGASRQQYGLPPADVATVRTPPDLPNVPPIPTQAPQPMGATSVAASAPEWDDEEDEPEWIAAAGFTEALHPRNPKGSAGGGRFRSLAERVADAIKGGGGKPDALDGFNTRQLKTAAKQSGISVSPGMSDAALRQALHEHHGGKALPKKATKAAKKAAPTRVAQGEAALAAAPIAMPDLDGGGARGFDTLPDGELHALRFFRGEGYRQITPALYRGKASPAVQERIDHLDSVMKRSRLERDVVTYRGVTDIRKLVGARAAQEDLSGAQFTDRAFLSTSADEVQAKFFSRKGAKTSDTRPTVFRYTIPKGTAAVKLSGVKHESELLLQRGLTFRIVADHGVAGDGIRYLDLEVVTA